MDLSLITYHFILPMLEYFRHVFGNYGWAIIVVTIIVKVVLYPLTKKQTDSMKKMQALQPKIKILQERFNQQKDRYKDRPAKLKEAQTGFQKEMMEFYQTNKVNPLGGCFPMLVQLPILIALFWAFNGSPFKPVAITTEVEILNTNQVLSEQKVGSSKPQIFLDASGNKARFVLNPGHVKITPGKDTNYMIFKLDGNVSDIAKDIKWQLSDRPYFTSGYTPRDLSSLAALQIAPDNSATVFAKGPGRLYLHAVLPGSSEGERFLFISGLGKTGPVDSTTGRLNIDVIILVLLFGITIWLSGKVTAKAATVTADPKQQQMQKTMQNFMPPMVTIMTLFFPVPAGVLLYFVASGFIQALQTWMIMRTPA